MLWRMGRKHQLGGGEGDWGGQEPGSRGSKLEPGEEHLCLEKMELLVSKDVWLLPVGLVAQAAVPKIESMQLPMVHC